MITKNLISKLLNALLTICAYWIIGFALALTIVCGVLLTQTEIRSSVFLHDGPLTALTLSPIIGMLAFLVFQLMDRFLLPPLYRDESLSKKDVLIIALGYINPIAIVGWVFYGAYLGLKAFATRFLPWIFRQLATHP